MKRQALLLLLGLACGLVLSAAGPDRGRGGSLSLIRIPRERETTRVLARLGVDVRQELHTCFVALADGPELSALRRSHVRFSVLERDAAGREILFVETPAAGDLDRLRRAGHAVAVEPGTTVFWSETGTAAESVPSDLRRKALPGRSVLPYVTDRPDAATAAAAATAQDPFIETMVSLVSASGLSADVQMLQDFQTRYASTAACESAGAALFDAFSALGLDDVRYEPFTFAGSYASRNVVAEKTGTTFPSGAYIICAHYDSTSPDRLTLAPGADDNASGTAAVLEVARILAPYSLDYTVRFIAFSAEEWGLYGSQAYAAAARAAGEEILGVLDLDMIGYADAVPEDLSLIVNSRSGWLADLFQAAGAHYGPVGGTKKVDPSIVYSDHSPFWDNGYPALLAIEDYPLTNPYYHRTSDTLGTLDVDFFTSSTRASLGLLAELAQPVRDGYPSPPTGLTASWITYRSLFNVLPIARLAWNVRTDAIGYNVYRATSPHGALAKVNLAPVAGPEFLDSSVTRGLTYYYVVRAVGPGGLESNRSREVPTPIMSSWMSSRGIGLVNLRGTR